MKRLLLIIDPQVDFISGSLPVPGAPEAMDALARHIAETAGLYDAVIISADRHPFDHSSFADNGGPWPRHCVADSVGAAIWPPVLEAAHLTKRPVCVLYKGTASDREEYSVFQSSDAARAIADTVSSLAITDIDICGLAGDVCVLSSLSDGLAALPGCRFRVLTAYSPSIDGGNKLNDFINKHSVTCIR